MSLLRPPSTLFDELLAQVKDGVRPLCSLLNCMFSSVQLVDSHFYSAKLDKNSGDCIITLWKTVHNFLCQDKDCKAKDWVTCAKVYLAIEGYSIIQFFALPIDRSTGSQRILEALSWMIANHFIEKELNVRFTRSSFAQSYIRRHKRNTLFDNQLFTFLQLAETSGESLVGHQGQPHDCSSPDGPQEKAEVDLVERFIEWTDNRTSFLAWCAMIFEKEKLPNFSASQLRNLRILTDALTEVVKEPQQRSGDYSRDSGEKKFPLKTNAELIRVKTLLRTLETGVQVISSEDIKKVDQPAKESTTALKILSRPKAQSTSKIKTSKVTGKDEQGPKAKLLYGARDLRETQGQFNEDAVYNMLYSEKHELLHGPNCVECQPFGIPFELPIFGPTIEPNIRRMIVDTFWVGPDIAESQLEDDTHLHFSLIGSPTVKISEEKPGKTKGHSVQIKDPSCSSEDEYFSSTNKDESPMRSGEEPLSYRTEPESDKSSEEFFSCDEESSEDCYLHNPTKS